MNQTTRSRRQGPASDGTTYQFAATDDNWQLCKRITELEEQLETLQSQYDVDGHFRELAKAVEDGRMTDKDAVIEWATANDVNFARFANAVFKDAEERMERPVGWMPPAITKEVPVTHVTDTVENLQEIVDDQKKHIAELEEQLAYDEEMVELGVAALGFPDDFVAANKEIARLRTDLQEARRAAEESRYTMPPNTLYELMRVAYEAANHKTNWPDDWPKGRQGWRDKARQQLIDAFSKLEFVTSDTADEMNNW
jgi:hypothetical protein